MNLYFLVEGKRTEPKIYPSWFGYLLPNYSKIQNPGKVSNNNYYLISGLGFPALFNHLKNSIFDVNKIGKFDYLVLILDSEEETIASRKQEVLEFLQSENLKINCEFEIIVQHHCIESWLLANKKVFTYNPQDPELLHFIDHYDVSQKDPEHCPPYGKYSNHAKFHEAYLKSIMKEKNLSYSKKLPGTTKEYYYLEQLIKRSGEDNHIQSFKALLDFCSIIRNS